MIHAKIEKNHKPNLDTVTLIDKLDNDKIVAVLNIRNSIVKGFDKAFFYIYLNDMGMIYFESFCIIQELVDGSKMEVERECKPKNL